ncbi:uncharacterized protein LOC129778121 isoform X2 [Toxorhynchites rutilus septentrionalis]|uniref:uncharacterized protein LOC129778121 isoform X2 n=1 Tax=Toxorhynchites rutilus septentrionalis TaxID=329112 RepID=UPI0024789A1A|nr:uncharacterized protein LOC129778121 isoform X2 [Toxorhynchites rutilus septentrionalis]
MKMTAPRLVARASRSRFFVGLGILVLMVGFVAIFHSSQQQLDELRHLGLRCEQQQEAISAKMQVVVDQKLRLENSLASERMINEQSRVEQQQKAQDEKEQHNKSTMEANIRYASLQQHYNLMKSQLDDLTEECSKSKKRQLEEVNSLRLKVSELQGKIALHQKESASDVEQLKAQVNQLKLEKASLDSTYRQKIAYKNKIMEKLKEHNEKMEKENAQYMELCNIPPEKMPHHLKASDAFEGISFNFMESGPLRNFAEQISVSEDLYKIPVVLRNHTNKYGALHGGALVLGVKKQVQEGQGVIAKPYETNDVKSKLVAAAADGGVINSVENFQIIPKPLPLVPNEADGKKDNQQNNVLQEPQLLKTSTSIPSSLNKKTSERNSNLQVPILAAPTVVSPDGGKSSSSSTSTTTPSSSLVKKSISKLRTKILPVGVVPFPDNIEDLMKVDENNSENAVNNRYLNIAAHQGQANNDEKRSRNDKDINFINGNVDLENGAHEQPNVKDGTQNRDNFNAAEEDTNLYDQKLFGNAMVQQQPQHADYNEMHQHLGAKKDGGGNAGAAVGKGSIGEKLINEIVRDHGKEGDNYPNEMEEDLHLDGQQEGEEEGDIGDYDDPAAMKQGHAERN